MMDIKLDALIPMEMAAKGETVGVTKARMSTEKIFALSILAGAFIALGAIFSTTVLAGTAGLLPYGVQRLLAGLVFTLGLILVIVGGAELFTGNNLITMAWANNKVSTGLMIKNWIIVYIGNLAGSILTVVIMFYSGQFTFGNGAIGVTALGIATAKVQLGFVQAVALGIMCNAMVCMAVWLCFSARTTTDRILAIIPPISGFVAAGFEHSIANMYFIPIGLFIKGGASEAFWTMIKKTPADFSTLTWGGFFINNLVPVTIGNVIGGGIMVGLVYWFVYLRAKKSPAPNTAEVKMAPVSK
jgi:formate transporter FocA